MSAKIAIHTEEEASRKWCPRAIPARVSCLGSRCMAWRWFETHVLVNGELVKSGDTYGYCGLSGRPEPVMVAEAEGRA